MIVINLLLIIDTMIISLGSDCVVKKRLEEFVYNDKQVSHIFDWVLSDLNAVCHILEQYMNFNQYFSIDKLSIITKTIENKYAIKHNDCYFISLHDASCDISENEAKALIVDKYNRRLQRFVDAILNPENEITFIGLYDKYNPIQNGNMKIHDNDVMRFFKIINKLCPMNTHKLILYTDDDNNLKESIKYKNRIQILNSKKYINMKDYVSDWYRFFLNWNDMFFDSKLLK